MTFFRLSAIVGLDVGVHVDTAAGSAGTPRLDAVGSALDDTLFAGPGDDHLDGGDGRDSVSYRFAGAAVAVSLAIAGPQATGGSGSDTLRSIENLAGSAFDDVLAGNAGANILDGGAGADTLRGAAGDDTYIVDAAGDVVDEAPGAGSDTVVTALAAWTLGDAVEHLRLTAAGSADGTGNAADNVLFAGAGDNLLDGRGGLDTASYRFAGGAVAVDLARAGPQATGGSGRDTLISIEQLEGSRFADRLSGDAGANRLDGGDGNDTLAGAAGVDTLVGGRGDDTFFVDAPGDVVVERAGGGRDTVVTGLAAYALGADVEHLRLTAPGGADGRGNALDNTLFAGPGDDRLDGGAGADTASYRFAGAAVDADLARGDASGGSGRDMLVAIEFLEGSRFADRLSGDAGANRLDGGAGADTLTGAGGDDTYWVDDPRDVVVEADAEPTSGGIDTVVSRVAAWTLGANVENLRIAASGPADGAGNALDNRIEAGPGANRIDGGAGVDTVSYATAARWVVGSVGGDISSSKGVTDVLASIENLVGSPGNDYLIGDAGPNRLAGDAGDDQIVGRGGDDLLEGGAGADTLMDGAGTDTLSGGAGLDQFRIDRGAGVTEVADLELGESIFIIAWIDEIIAGDDASGLAPGRMMVGTPAGGRTRLSLDADGRPGAEQFIDLVGAYAASDFGFLDANSLLVFDPTLNGPGVRTGTGGPDHLLGGEFGDTLEGLGGNDTLRGGEGNDSLRGGDGDDRLDGNWGSDTLEGGDGVDVLDGFLDSNLLSGGPGLDRFLVKNSQLSRVDRITDLEPGETIELASPVLSLVGGGDESALKAGELMVGTPSGGVTRLLGTRSGPDGAVRAGAKIDLVGSYTVDDFELTAEGWVQLRRLDPSGSAGGGLIAVDSGVDAALFLFTSVGVELTLLQGTPSTAGSDILLGG